MLAHSSALLPLYDWMQQRQLDMENDPSGELHSDGDVPHVSQRQCLNLVLLFMSCCAPNGAEGTRLDTVGPASPLPKENCYNVYQSIHVLALVADSILSQVWTA